MPFKVENYLRRGGGPNGGRMTAAAGHICVEREERERERERERGEEEKEERKDRTA